MAKTATATAELMKLRLMRAVCRRSLANVNDQIVEAERIWDSEEAAEVATAGFRAVRTVLQGIFRASGVDPSADNEDREEVANGDGTK